MQLLGTGKQRAGKQARVQVGNQFLCFGSWENTMRAADLPTINFESYNVAAGETYDEGLHAHVGVDTRFGGLWDAGTDPLGTPPGLYVRDDLASVAHIVNRIDTTQWTFPYLRLRSAVNSAEVSGLVQFNCSGISQGPFVFPTLSV